MKRTLYSLIGAGILLILVMNLPEAVTARLNVVVRDTLAPLLSSLSRGHVQLQAFFIGRRALTEENTRLKVEVEGLRHELRWRDSLEQENQELRNMLGLAAHARHRLVAAEVIVRDVNGWWQMLRVNKGAADGVSRNQPAITTEGVVGCIMDVSSHTCDVLLLVDPNCRIAARLAGQDAFGIVRGEGVTQLGDSQCRMDFIVKEADVKPGDEVVTSGLGGVFPPGLIIGYVEQVYLDRSRLYQYADLIPAVNLRALNLVFIITGAQPAPNTGP